MAWTTPRTWVNNETVTHTMLNEQIRDNLDFLRSKDHVSVYKTAVESVSDSTWEKIPFDAEHFDSNTMHDNATANSRLRCNSDGLYLAVFKVNFDTNATGNRRVMMRENAAGSDVGGTNRGTWSGGGLTGNNTTVAGSRLLRLVDTDYIELFAWQNSGGNLDVVDSSDATWFQLMQLAG